MIPKRIFFYWGNEELSWMRYMTLYSFRKMNPDWEMVVCLSKHNAEWGLPRKQDFSYYTGPDYFNKIFELDIIVEEVQFPDDFKSKFDIISPIHESDLYRYYKLYSGGGFYSDMDILYFRPMGVIYDEIISSKYNTIICQYPGWVTIGFLGASKDNLFYKDLLFSAFNFSDRNNYQSYGACLIYRFFNFSPNNYVFVNKIKEKYKKLKVYNTHQSVVYYYDCNKIDYAFANSLNIKDFGLQSIGYHWYGGHQTSQKYNNILNENNYTNYKTTFSEISKAVL